MKKRSHNSSGRNPQSAHRQLATYRSKRDFEITPEPSGNAARKKSSSGHGGLSFVIQKHAASHLHYDFRLEWNGVLKSWAVAKGPSYYPGDRRLAIEVEDHPLDYGGFEGIIPKGQYGGGTVMVWDRGTWEPVGDAAKGLRDGNLKFTLHGEKLKGDWALVRMKNRVANPSKPNWLLIKEHDGNERGEKDPAITEEAPDSALSGRDMQAIAEAHDAVWNSNHREEHGRSKSRNARSYSAKQSAKLAASIARQLVKLPKERLPSFIKPQLAMLAQSAPATKDRVHEIKLDGYRIQARIEPGGKSPVQLLTRTGLDWTARMKPIAEALRELPVQGALLDGEVVVLKKDGTTSFAQLQAAFQEGTRYPLIYFVFDLLHLDGHNLRNEPLLMRKKILSELLQSLPQDGTIRLSEYVAGAGRIVLEKACALGAEGIISKLAQGEYTSGRSRDWLKLKCHLEQEFVIGGFTHPSNRTHGVGALLLGYYQNGELVYAGRTGTGFTQKTHRMMRDRLDAVQRKTSPFAHKPDGATRGVHWVTPELVAQVAFSNWTADDLVRQAVFKGLREDKPAKSVHREEAKAMSSEGRAEHRSRKSVSHKEKPQAKKSSAVTNSPEPLPVRLTHPTKVLDKDSGLTKEELARYYAAIAPYMLAYIKERPVSIVRCPSGTGKKCFFQKHTNNTLPQDIRSIEVADPKTGEAEPYITLATPENLMELAQLNVLEIHAWGSTDKSLEKPDQIVIDLDPDDAIDWQTLAAAADEVRKRMKAAGLKSFLKTTGGKGLHVVAPVEPEKFWAEVKDFAHQLVLKMESENRSLYLTRMTKAARKGKIYLDYLRNERGATAIAPFSPRARAGAPVALPLKWSELKAGERPVFRVADFPEWKRRLKSDPWKRMQSVRQAIP